MIYREQDVSRAIFPLPPHMCGGATRDSSDLRVQELSIVHPSPANSIKPASYYLPILLSRLPDFLPKPSQGLQSALPNTSAAMGTWPFGSSSSPEPSRDRSRQAPTTPPYPPPHPSRDNDDDDDDDDNENPFINFRRAVDDHFRLLASGLSNLPSILHELQTRGESETPSEPSRWTHDSFAARAEQPLAFMSQHFEHPSWPAANSSPPSEEAIAATRVLLLQSRTACAQAGLTPSAVLRLYRDMDTTHHFFGNPDHAWLSVSWFRLSPYSPIQLETHHHAHQHGSMWRAAFEDLLSASTGREVAARDAWIGVRPNQSLYAAWAQTPRDWMLGLQCRGILPPQLPSLYELGCTRRMDRIFGRLISGQHVGRWGGGAQQDFLDLAREIGTVDPDEQYQAVPRERTLPHPTMIREIEPPRKEEQRHEETELDAYEQFLGKASGTQHVTPIAREKETSRSQQQTSSIISTLSTTERTVLPDGTVTTKVVLRKRFADGREESSETVTTSIGHQSESQNVANAESQVGDSNGVGDKAKSKGWFWN